MILSLDKARFAMASVFAGSIFLFALIVFPVVGWAQECPWLYCDGIRDSMKVDTKVVGTTVYGSITHNGNVWQNIYHPEKTEPECGFYPGDWGLDPVYIKFTPYDFSGIPKSYDTCEQVCNFQSAITAGFAQTITPGILYEFQWKLGGCLSPIFYAKRIYLPSQSWDAPTCSTCVGDSATACVHPTPRSLVISSRPDLTLPSPLGDRTIERTYRTGLVGDTIAGDGMFGKGWRANFEFRIGTINGSNSNGVMLFDAAGRKIFYQLRPDSSNPMVYDSPDGKGGLITKTADGSYLWQDAQGSSYQFDAAGNIQSITDIHDNQETFVSSGGRITSLIDRHGRVMTFDYQGTNHVTRLLGPPIASNPDGVYATYGYDAYGNLSNVTFPDGNAQIYEYTNSTWRNHMTRFSFVGPLGPGFQQLIQYDAQGRVLASSEGPEGRSFQLAYGSELVYFDPAHPQMGQITLSHTTVTEWTDANWDFQINGDEVPAAQRTYYYQRQGGADVVTKIEDGGCSCAAVKQYDSAFHVVQSRDNKGVTSLMSYNDQGDLTSLTEAAGTADERITRYEYAYAATPVIPGQIIQKTTQVPSVVSPSDDKLTTEIFDPATGKLLTRREQGYRVDGSSLAAETVYNYTTSGAVQSVDGPRPGTVDQSTYEYNPPGDPGAGMLWKITEPNGAVTTFQQYDGLGNVLHKTDANNRDTIYSYNSRGLLQTQTTVDGTTQYEYDAQGNIARTMYPKGNSVAYSHGQSGLSRVSDATGRIEYGYANGNKISESVYDTAEALQKSTMYDYDVNNRLLRTRQAGGDFEEYLYDENGNLTARTIYAAATPTVPFKSTIQGYDLLNRLTTVSVEGDPYHVSYAYDTQGNLSTMTDPLDQNTRYLYDDLGHQNRVVSPETGTTEFTPDEVGNVVSRKDNLNRLISYTYDGSNRLIKITYTDTTPAVDYRYDNYSTGSYPDAVGRLTEITDASGLRRFFYNPAGRLNKVVHTIDEQVFITEYIYDANGNLASLTYPSGRRIQYAYDPASDRVVSVTSWKNGVPTVLAEGITHKPFGPIDGFNYGNGVHLAKGYENHMYRLASLAVTGSHGNPVPARSYDYDPAGNIHGITRDLPGGAEPHFFGYDLMDRLSSWSKPERTQELIYDANGNRQSLSDDGLFTDYTYDPVAKNILASSTGTESLAYDSDTLGNITGWGTKSLVYDTNNRLSRVENSGLPLGEYIYNIDGQRTKKTASDQTTYFEYDADGRMLHEYRVVGGIAVDYVYLGSEPLALLVSNDHAVTPNAGANGRLTPSSPQPVVHNQTTAFIVAPDTGYHIVSVTGCGGTLNEITYTYTTGQITENCSVTASFAINTYNLTTTISGDGTGTVTSSPTGINCGTSCSTMYDYGTVVNLSQTANAGDVFTGWNGDCSGTGTCEITMTAARTVDANFSKGMTLIHPNGGTVYYKDRNRTIEWSYLGDPGSSVKIELLKGGVLNTIITASTAIGSNGSGSFVWHVPSTQATGSDYRIRVTSTTSDAFTDMSNADFAIDCYTVTPVAGANGSLTPSNPQPVIYNQTTAFTVTPDAGYHVVSVTGCGGPLDEIPYSHTYTTGPITENCTVTASFIHNIYYGLTVTKSGTGTGPVTSSPAGINCGATCSTMYNDGDVVSLSQTANAGKVFTGWSGSCTGTGACVVTMTADLTVDANFTKGITLIRPNGGTIYYKNSDRTIQWSYLGDPGSSVKIELLKGGVLDTTITSGTPIGSNGNGSFVWHVPSTQATGSDYKVRVTSTTKSAFTDASNANFTIN